MKKTLSIILSLIMLLTTTAGLDFSSYAQTYSGSCGTNVNWSLDTSTGKLTISGSGDMTNYSSYANVPWYNQRSQIKTVDIQSGVTSIGNDAFYDCDNLTSITIPNSVTNIGNVAFYSCSSLTSITIPNSVTSIGRAAFRYCSSLTSITIPNSVTSIGDSAFSSCSSLTSVTIPNSVTSIGNYAFSSCNRLKSVTIGNSVTSIGNYAFDDCSSLTSITIPNSVTSIGGAAFRYCISLTSIAIPNSVTSIGDSAFYRCDSLKDVYYSGSKEQWHKIQIGSSNSPLTSAQINCTDGVINEHIHSYNSGTITKSATCTSDGEKTYTCTKCNASKKETIKATGHSYDNGKITKRPTCTSYGEKTYTCYSCSHTITESVYPTGHTYMGKKVASTCTKQGYTLYTCTKCNSSYTGNYTALKAHSNKTYTTKATLSKNGSVVTKCSVCNKVAKSTVVYYPKTIALSKTAYTYNGKVQKPAVSVKDSNGKVIGAGNYTVAYPSGMKNIGQYTVKITFKGNYSGSVTKTFTIIPKPIDFSSVKSPKKGKVELKWKKASGITGYQVQISSKSNFAAKSTKTLSFKQSKTSTTGKLASKKTHYFRIRTYKTVKVNGKNTKIYSAWSKAKSVKIK